MTNRAALFAKIKALLSKTVENGCTEAEAFAALDKARAMMDAHDVSEADLELGAEALKRVETRKAAADRMRDILAVGVSVFCHCQVWRGEREELVFLGLESDALFASWLLDTLERFVQRRLMTFMMERGSFKVKERDRQRAGFVSGCCARIVERLKDAAATSKTAIAVRKAEMIAEAMRDAGIRTRAASNRGRVVDTSALEAGQRAGNEARWDRPMGGDNAAPLSLR